MNEPAQICAPEYHLLDTRDAVSHGGFDTIEDARAVAVSEGLRAWEIWRGDRRVEKHDPDVPDPPVITPSRDLNDRLGEALLRYRHGLMAPLWADMAEADKEAWRNLATAFVLDLKNVGVRIEVER